MSLVRKYVSFSSHSPKSHTASCGQEGRTLLPTLCLLRIVRSRLQGSQTTPVGSHRAWTVAGKGHSRQSLHQLRALHASQLPTWAPTPDPTPTASLWSLRPASEGSVICRYDQGREITTPLPGTTQGWVLIYATPAGQKGAQGCLGRKKDFLEKGFCL